MQNNPILQSRFKAAMQTLQSGKALDALRQFEAILKTDPNTPEVHFQMARILMQSKRQSKAADHLERARALAPTEPAVWQASLTALGAIGDQDKLNAFAKDVKRAKIPSPLRKELLDRLTKPSGSEWGGAPKIEIEALIKSLVARDAADASRLASSLHERFPDVGLITNAFATSCELKDQLDRADVFYRRAILQAPFDVSIRMNYGRFLRIREEHKPALVQFRRADAMRPNVIEILLSRADAARESSEPVEALETANRALAIKPDATAAKFIKSKALTNLNRADEAIILNDELITAEPDNASYWLERGITKEHLGAFDEAETSLLKALDLDPHRTAAYREISAIRKFTDGDPLFDRLQTEAKREDLTDAAMASIHFALGKMFEDTKKPELAFSHIKTANELDAKAFSFDKADTQRRYDSLKSIRDQVDLRKISDTNPQVADPIFVTGMPRSGTTLTEQLVAAHSTTTSVGEARWWHAALIDFWTDAFANSYSADDLAARIQRMGQDYIDLAKAENPNEGRIVDKSLMKQESMGLLLAAMPKAKVVVLKRDPRDNLLSIYKNPFNSKVVTFNNDFDALAWTYAQFLDFIDFWSEVFPDRIYVLDYNALTADPEKVSRELLEFCGLEWEDDVLEFHTKKSTVKTLSAYQVRQPIYQSSVRSWEKYGDDLKPLLDALEKYGVPLPD